MFYNEEGSIRLGRWLGVPFYFHWTALILVAIVVFNLSGGNAEGLTVVSQLTIIAFVLIHLFLAIGLHEMGHALIARANGATNLTITFGAFGGVCRSERVSRYWSDLAIVIAGPLVSFILAAFYALGTQLLTYFLPQIAASNILPPAIYGYLLVFCFYGNLINLGLGIFNCLPIFPMDGGQATFNILHIVMGTEGKIRSNTSVARNEQLVATIMIWLSIATALGYFAYRAGSVNPADILKYMADHLFLTLMIGYILYVGYQNLRNR
jgi:Zn-dependent protease